MAAGYGLDVTPSSIQAQPAQTQPTEAGAGVDQDEALFKALSSEHPDYCSWKERWKVYRDVTDDADFEKEAYLHQNEREHADQYAFRVKIAEFLPDTPSYLARLIGAVFDTKPARTLDRHPKLKGFTDSVTRARKGSALSSMDCFMEQVAWDLMRYGTIRVAVSSRSVPVGASIAEEQDAGARPYIILYSPLSVIDWAEDDDAELTMARVREEFTRKADPDDPISPHVKHIRFIQYGRMVTRWWVFRQDPDDPSKWIRLTGEDGEGEAEHNLGIVPMVVHYWPKAYRTMIGCSFVRYMARAEVSKFRSDSDLDYDTHMHAHPALCLKTNKKTKEDIVIGGGRYIKLLPGDGVSQGEDAFYLQYPTPAFDALKQTIDSKRASVKRYASVDPAGMFEEEASPNPASGVSRAFSFGTSEARLLSSLADALAEIEAGIYDMVLRYWGEKPDKDGIAFQGEVQYSEEFEVGTGPELLDEIERAGATINSPTLIKFMQKRYARKKAGDAGQKLLEEIDEEIESRPVLASAVRDERDLFDMPVLGVDDAEDEDDQEEDVAPAGPPPRTPAARNQGPQRRTA